jgi:chromosomal replication initiation ATPase DnaA
MDPKHNPILARFTEVLNTQGLDAAMRAVAVMRHRVREAHPAVFAVARFYAMKPSTLIHGGKARCYSRPRHVLMWVLRQTGMSYPAIAKELKLRNHTSVLHGVRMVEANLRLIEQAREILARVGVAKAEREAA